MTIIIHGVGGLLFLLIRQNKEVSLHPCKYAQGRECFAICSRKKYEQVEGLEGICQVSAGVGWGGGQAPVGGVSPSIFTLPKAAPGLQCPLQALLGNARVTYKL